MTRVSDHVFLKGDGDIVLGDFGVAASIEVVFLIKIDRRLLFVVVLRPEADGSACV